MEANFKHAHYPLYIFHFSSSSVLNPSFEKLKRGGGEFNQNLGLGKKEFHLFLVRIEL